MTNEISNKSDLYDKIVILSHHAPTLQKSSIYDDPLKKAYATNLEWLMKNEIVLWVFGHTHYKTDFYINNTRIVSNPFGYRDEQTGYEPNTTIKV